MQDAATVLDVIGKRGARGLPGRRGAPVEEVSLKNTRYRERLRVVSYRVMLDVPRELIWFVSGLLAVRRAKVTPAARAGSCIARWGCRNPRSRPSRKRRRFTLISPA